MGTTQAEIYRIPSINVSHTLLVSRNFTNISHDYYFYAICIHFAMLWLNQLFIFCWYITDKVGALIVSVYCIQGSLLVF
jgi:hypothetical protein